MIIATDFAAKVSPPGCAATGVVSSSNEKIAPPASRARLDLMRFLARGLLASCATFYERSAVTPSRTASPRMGPAGANGSEVERGTERDHPRILSEASVAVQDAGRPDERYIGPPVAASTTARSGPGRSSRP